MTKNLATIQNIVCFRQTFNQYSKNWVVPLRLMDDGKWAPISKEGLSLIVTKKDGYRFALWRMRDVMVGIKDEYKRPVWKVNPISTRYVTIKDVKYSIYQFDCHRIFHGIVGGMNSRGGA